MLESGEIEKYFGIFWENESGAHIGGFTRLVTKIQALLIVTKRKNGGGLYEYFNPFY